MEQTLIQTLSGHSPDPQKVTSWLGRLARAQQPELACSVLLALRRIGVEINVFHYNAAISACGKGQKWALAVGLLAEMGIAKVAKM